LLKTDAKTVIIDMITEGIHAIERKEISKLLSLDKTYYLFSNGYWDTSQYPLNYKILYFPYFLHQSIRFSNLCVTNFWFSNLVNYSNNGKFCSLIGFNKPWRDELVSKLLNNGLEDNFISYEGIQLGNIKIEDQFLIGEYDSYTPYLENDHYSISSSIPVDIFNATSYCLVVETNMRSFNEFHLTEKTIKCLSTGMPFVVASSYNFLKNLRSMGFKTYCELWDESYDEIKDVNHRMDAIVLLCKKLSTFNWKDNRNKLNEIAYHNIRVLLNSSNIFESAIINILRTLNGY
jgi:hypothetical protein